MYFLRIKLNLREKVLLHIIPMFITTQKRVFNHLVLGQ